MGDRQRLEGIKHFIIKQEYIAEYTGFSIRVSHPLKITEFQAVQMPTRNHLTLQPKEAWRSTGNNLVENRIRLSPERI